MTDSSWAVVTSNVGRYDFVPHVPASLAEAADCVLVTDERRTARVANRRGWRSVVVPADNSPHVTSRLPKTRPDQFTGAAKSLWVDGRFRLAGGGLLDWAESSLGEAALALYRHPQRSTLADEAAYCVSEGFAPESITSQIASYGREGAPSELPLWAGGVIARWHNDAVASFGDTWMQEIRRWDSRDQISLPIALWRCSLEPVALSGSPYENSYLVPRQHRHRWVHRKLRRVVQHVGS